MKKILVGILGFVIIFTLFGCHQVKNQMEKIAHPDHKKIEDVREILDKVLEHIADHNPELSFEDGELLDSELGVPHFDIVSISENSHFKEKDVVDGFIVRPVVDVDNPKLLIVVEAVDKEASGTLNKAMIKVKSDQQVQFQDAGILVKYLIDNNKTVRQGNYLIYVTWEGAEDIVKVFERHVR
jgi:hypothetical protein